MIHDVLAAIGSRIADDPIASRITGALILGQIALWCWFWWQTGRPLKRQRKALVDAKGLVAATDQPTTIRQKVPAEVRSALERAFPNDPALLNADLRDELIPEEVLPPDYNGRLDAAASGIFVAIGIFGTFVGLSIAFIRIDFGQAASSIVPMIGGMLIAFVNSLVGVALSILWTIFSRLSRHKYDVACHELEQTLEVKYEPHRRRSQVLAALGQLDAGTGLLRREISDALTRLRTEMQVGRAQQAEADERVLAQLVSMERATANSSQDLLEKLAPKLEESFKALVDLPFERLTNTVDDFRGTVDALAERNERTLAGFDAALASLAEANDSLATAVDAAQHIVASFDKTVNELSGSATSARGLTEQTAAAAESILKAGDTIESIGTRFGQLGSALGGAVTELRATSGALDSSSTRFDEAAARLNATTEEVRGISKELSEEAVSLFRSELETFLHSMSSSLKAASESNVAAFAESSSRIIETVDDRVSDLADRMSAELNTLAARLPEAAAEITSSAGKMRRQLVDAVKHLETAVKTMDRDSTTSLATRLKEYDELVAKAVGRFSGTLSQWTSRVDDMKLIVEQLADIERLRSEGATLPDNGDSTGDAGSVATLIPTDRGPGDAVVS